MFVPVYRERGMWSKVLAFGVLFYLFRAVSATSWRVLLPEPLTSGGFPPAGGEDRLLRLLDEICLPDDGGYRLLE